MLKPLGDILGVSVGELLSGKIIEEAEMKDQTDRIILDSLKYSSRMLANMVNLVLFLIGLALVISPVFLTSRKYYWVGGIVFIGIAVLRTYLKKEGKTVKLTDRAFYAVGIAPSPTERVIHTYSYFDLNLVGYANFSPMLTGILTVAVVILGITILCRYEKAKKRKKAVFVCSVIAFVLSFVPLFMFSSDGMTMISYVISAAMAVSICFQAVANRRELSAA